jgi:hypothetical protein
VSPETKRSPLERLLAPISAAEIDDVAGSNPPEWLHVGEWRVLARAGTNESTGEVIEAFARANGQTLHARFDPDEGRVSIPFNLSEAYLNYVHERWRVAAQTRGLSDRQLAVFYRAKRVIPRSVQIRARQVLIRRQKNPEFPAWPLDTSVSNLLRLYAKCQVLAGGCTELPFRWFWPKPYHAALILTHDVESAEGLRLAVELADLEEVRGFRSSFNIVADWYPIDWGIVGELRDRGFELGVHGVHHDRSMFSSRAAFDSQQPAVREMAAKLGAVGFRSPATHRVVDWLADLPIEYDCSIPHSDPFEPQPGGCCSLWPFFIGDVIALPYTLPQDNTLFTLLGHHSIDLWQTQLERIERLNGLAEVVSHPDPGYLGDPSKRALYSEFLDLVRDRPDLWTPLPREAADWWRIRDSGDDADDRMALGIVRLDGAAVRMEPNFVSGPR